MSFGWQPCPQLRATKESFLGHNLLLSKSLNGFWRTQSQLEKGGTDKVAIVKGARLASQACLQTDRVWTNASDLLRWLCTVHMQSLTEAMEPLKTHATQAAVRPRSAASATSAHRVLRSALVAFNAFLTKRHKLYHSRSHVELLAAAVRDVSVIITRLRREFDGRRAGVGAVRLLGTLAVACFTPVNTSDASQSEWQGVAELKAQGWKFVECLLECLGVPKDEGKKLHLHKLHPFSEAVGALTRIASLYPGTYPRVANAFASALDGMEASQRVNWANRPALADASARHTVIACAVHLVDRHRSNSSPDRLCASETLCRALWACKIMQTGYYVPDRAPPTGTIAARMLAQNAASAAHPPPSAPPTATPIPTTITTTTTTTTSNALATTSGQPSSGRPSRPTSSFTPSSRSRGGRPVRGSSTNNRGSNSSASANRNSKATVHNGAEAGTMLARPSADSVGLMSKSGGVGMVQVTVGDKCRDVEISLVGAGAVNKTGEQVLVSADSTGAGAEKLSLPQPPDLPIPRVYAPLEAAPLERQAWEDNKAYQVVLGESFSRLGRDGSPSDGSGRYMHLKYDFVPTRTDLDAPAEFRSSRKGGEKRWTAEMEFGNRDVDDCSGAVRYEGDVTRLQDIECALVFDGEKFVMERIETMASMKHVQAERERRPEAKRPPQGKPKKSRKVDRGKGTGKGSVGKKATKDKDAEGEHAASMTVVDQGQVGL
ncbi:unnamed protein product [Choristocarpus tenellus]